MIAATHNFSAVAAARHSPCRVSSSTGSLIAAAHTYSAVAPARQSTLPRPHIDWGADRCHPRLLCDDSTASFDLPRPHIDCVAVAATCTFSAAAPARYLIARAPPFDGVVDRYHPHLRRGSSNVSYDLPRFPLDRVADCWSPHLLCGSAGASFGLPLAPLDWVAYRCHSHLPGGNSSASVGLPRAHLD
jgi:hypothetical protein